MVGIDILVLFKLAAEVHARLMINFCGRRGFVTNRIQHLITVISLLVQSVVRDILDIDVIKVLVFRQPWSIICHILVVYV